MLRLRNGSAQVSLHSPKWAILGSSGECTGECCWRGFSEGFGRGNAAVEQAGQVSDWIGYRHMINGNRQPHETVASFQLRLWRHLLDYVLVLELVDFVSEFTAI